MKKVKNLALLILSLIAILALAPACDGEDTEPGGTDGDSDIDSETEATGLADTSVVANKADLVGNVYVLDFADDYWSKPDGFGKDIGSSTPTFAFEITAVDTVLNTFTATLGTYLGGAQDLCNITYVITGTMTDASSTTFTTAPIDVVAIVTGPDETKAQSTIHNFSLQGSFINQGAGYKYGVLTAELDARDIYPLFYQIPSTDGANLCENLGIYGLECEVCSFETTVSLCLSVMADTFKVTASQGPSLTAVTESGAGCL